jgi:hypothetical protein
MDNIPHKLLKEDNDLTANILCNLFENNLETGKKKPEEWRKGLLFKLLKKENVLNCSNWRGITLPSVISKIFPRIIHERTKSGMETKLRKEQASFRSNRSCVDEINTFRILTEQSNTFHNALYLLVIDFEKAFDSIYRDEIWIELKNYGIPPKIIKLIQES